MFKAAAKELRSSLIRNSLKSFVVSPLIRKFQVCAVRTMYVGKSNKENIWLQRRKMENVLEYNEHTVFMQYCNGRKESKSKEAEKWFGKQWWKKNTVTIIVAFISGLCLIGLNMAYSHLKNIYVGKVLTAEFVWYLAKSYGQEVTWQFFIYLFILNTATSKHVL